MPYKDCEGMGGNGMNMALRYFAAKARDYRKAIALLQYVKNGVAVRWWAWCIETARGDEHGVGAARWDGAVLYRG